MADHAPHFRTLVKPETPPLALPLDTRFLFIGSCFSEEISARFRTAGLPAASNPFGILYHPFAIARCLQHLRNDRAWDPEELVRHDDMWHSLDHHGSFSRRSREACLQALAESLRCGTHMLRQCQVLVLTLGSGWVYHHLQRDQPVANCHRLPPESFARRLTHATAIADVLGREITALHETLPELRQIVLTVSPVRHLRDSPAGNQLGKAHLIAAAALLVEQLPHTHYFPAFEMMIDDLRDYRFYRDDKVHPTDLAVDYIWGHFRRWAYTGEIETYCDHREQLMRRLQHRHREPDSAAARAFDDATREAVDHFLTTYPFAALPIRS